MTTPSPSRVEKIRERHRDFQSRYSPGPDWEPFNQTHLDRGSLLAAYDVLTEDRNRLSLVLAVVRGDNARLTAERDRLRAALEEMRMLWHKCNRTGHDLLRGQVILDAALAEPRP